MLTLKIKEENYRKFVEETSRKREDWIKSISDSAVVIMERQRYLMGMSKQEFYGVFLGCPMNSRTYRKIIEKQILVPENLLLSFCFTYGYDLKRFQEVSKLIDTHDYFENYQQIGATQNIPVTPTILAKIIENNNKNTTLRMIESGIENIVSIRLL